MKKTIIISALLFWSIMSFGQNAETLLNSGIEKYDIDDFKGAIVDYNKALEIDSNYTEVYFKRGLAKVMLDDFNGAISDYSKAIELNPNYSEAYFKRGLVKAVLDDKNGACSDYKKSSELGYLFALDLIKAYCK